MGIGTDFTQGHGREFIDWLNHDKGIGRKLVEMGDVYNLKGMETLACFPNITAALVRAGWEETRIRKVLGENWVNLLKEVWGS